MFAVRCHLQKKLHGDLKHLQLRATASKHILQCQSDLKFALSQQRRLSSIQIPPPGSFEEESWAQLHLSDGSLIKTRLVVGADGARSGVRRLAGLKELGWNYDQWGVVATLQLAEVRGIMGAYRQLGDETL